MDMDDFKGDCHGSKYPLIRTAQNIFGVNKKVRKQPKRERGQAILTRRQAERPWKKRNHEKLADKSYNEIKSVDVNSLPGQKPSIIKAKEVMFEERKLNKRLDSKNSIHGSMDSGAKLGQHSTKQKNVEKKKEGIYTYSVKLNMTTEGVLLRSTPYPITTFAITIDSSGDLATTKAPIEENMRTRIKRSHFIGK